MIPAPIPAHEAERLSALYEYDILDTIPEAEYDDITRIAAEICNMPISLISIIDNDRQWFKSRIGLKSPETHRDLAFCAHAILDPEEIMEVPDAEQDERFFDNPLVTGDPNISFYAGVPLVNEDGNALGTLCVIDHKPNALSEEQKVTLTALARQIVAYLEIRKKNHQLAKQKEELEMLNQELDRFAYVIAHDIKSPCSSLIMATELIREIYANTPNEEGNALLAMMEESSHAIIKMVDGILKHTLSINNANVEKTTFVFGDFMKEALKLLPLTSDFDLHFDGADTMIHTSRYVLMQIIVNLCTNAIKYNDKPHGEISITLKEDEHKYLFTVADNGMGMKKESLAVIFDLFSTLGVKDRNNNSGHGIGLSTVKRLVLKMDGRISVESEPEKGSKFTFSIAK